MSRGRGVAGSLASYILVASLIAAPQAAQANELQSLSLEELLELELDVAAKKGRTIRESPAVVSLVTRDEIEKGGARDLMDVLLRVPGVSFGMDVNGVVGIGFRGIWGHEGKVLFLVDGQEMNENLYSSMQWGHHIPLDNVDRVEIIRGPGSAIYGGYAELAVINVITRSGGQIDGAEAGVIYGSSSEDFLRRGGALAYGKKYDNGLEVGISGAFLQGHRSDADFRDFYGGRYSMLKHGDLANGFANVGLGWKGVSFRYVYDDYRMDTRDGFDAITPDTYDQSFTSHLAEVKYDAKIGPVTLTPKLNYKSQVPWRTPEKANDAPFYDKTADRFTAGMSASWDAFDGFHVLGGAEAYEDHAYLNDTELVGFQTQFANGKDEVRYQNLAAYSQLLWDNPIANVTVGARYENHSEFGSSFVPRAALTKVIDRFHVKLLYSNAFRAPGIENLRVSNGEVKPERTTVYEAEAGYKITSGMFVTANVFDITIEDPIVYFYSDELGEDYVNYDRTGSRGVELEGRMVQGRRHASLGVSMYTAAGKNEVPNYETDEDATLLAMPRLKVVATGGTNIGDSLNLDASAILIGPRKGYVEGDGTGAAALEETDPALLFNLFLRWENAFTRNLEVGAGLFNVFGAEYDMIQAYDSGHAPLPTNAREGLVRLTYKY